MSALHSAFLKRAALHPDRPALSHRATTWTYGELRRRALSIAASLPSVSTGSRLGVVAVVGEKTLDSVAAVLGALSAGYAYSTLPTDSPHTRFGAMLRLLRPVILITTNLSKHLSDVLVQVDHAPGAIIDLAGDLPPHAFANVPRLTCGTPADPRPAGDLAYVLFTSGSSGLPKGVCVSHDAATSAVEMFLDHHPLREDDHVANQVALCFDLSMFDIFATLSAGAELRLLDPVDSNPDRFVVALDRHRISSVYTVPTVLDVACRNATARLPSSLRQILVCGELLEPSLLERVFDRLSPETALWNLFGGTEMPYVLARKVEREFLGLANTFDVVGKHVDIRVDPRFGKDGEGELVVSGAILSRYLETADATLGRNVTEYHSGDIFRIERDGTITALGRTDRQVKIDGVRVELDVVERAIEAHPMVREAVVLASLDGFETIAFVVSCDLDERDLEVELDAHCREYLSPIECPARYVFLENLPRTASGKKNRVALRDSLHAGSVDEPSSVAQAAVTPL